MIAAPVSAALESELRSEVARQGIVLWLDRDGAYTAFVDALAAKSATADFPFAVVGFRGSFLELALKLESFAAGTEMPRLLVHMPGFTEESIRKTPVLELYEPGARYRKALDTLVRDAAQAHVTPADLEAFLTAPGARTLAEADAWLLAATADRSTGWLGSVRHAWRELLPEAIADVGSRLHAMVKTAADVATLREFLTSLVAMDAAWPAEYGEAPYLSPLDNLLSGLAAWVLCVEYVHDLKREPSEAKLLRLRKIDARFVKACSALAAGLRERHPEAYEQRADEVESFLGGELARMSADDLGHIDTFREEEHRVLIGAVEALRTGAWAKAKAYCEARRGEKSFWLKRDQTRRWAWSLVEEAAEFGAKLVEHPAPLEGATSLEEACARYAETGYVVDRAHRRFEQRRLQVLDSRLPQFGPLQEVASKLRSDHRQWADTLARAFSRLCEARGFLPAPELRQRTIFDDVVVPLVRSGDKVALFMVDAFRYEMATELEAEMRAAAATVVDLKPRLAELPSITSVGMNVLAPVTSGASGGQLVVAGAFKGFKAGEFTVRSPADRRRAMEARCGGKPALWLSLADACDTPTATLEKSVKAHGLIVVASREIDDAGEANVGLSTFEDTLRRLKAAVHHLQLAGVRAFVITADHGFLLQDETTKTRPFGRKVDPSRRHVLDALPRKEAGMVSVAVSSLGYEGIEGHLLFAEDTAVFDTGVDGATFTHGGNSLEERLIPVLTVTSRGAEKPSLATYMLEGEARPQVMGVHRIAVRLTVSSPALAFATAMAIGIGLRVPDRPEIKVTLKDASGPGKLAGGSVRLPLADGWTEVFFTLEGPADDRVQIEVHYPERIEKVEAAALADWFAVAGVARALSARPPASVPAPAAPRAWVDELPTDEVRRVFQHIDKHGVVTETELGAMLGSPRAVRKFAGDFDAYLAKLPFRVRVEAAEGGKRYVKEGAK